MSVIIRQATVHDFELIWEFLKPIVESEETYAFSPDLSYDDALHIWLELPLETYVAEESGTILGSYYIKQNFDGPGSHVSNCGYMVSSAAQGKGIATKMCKHSLTRAEKLGFKAMQFNCVVSSNERAIKLWQSLGFEIVGTLPKVYKHKALGFIDAHVMYKWL